MTSNHNWISSGKMLGWFVGLLISGIATLYFMIRTFIEGTPAPFSSFLGAFFTCLFSTLLIASVAMPVSYVVIRLAALFIKGRRSSWYARIATNDDWRPEALGLLISLICTTLFMFAVAAEGNTEFRDSEGRMTDEVVNLWLLLFPTLSVGLALLFNLVRAGFSKGPGVLPEATEKAGR
ncbi:hypothetical protein GCM10007276_34340 [Agaricicola taiwanensis]|uniref:Uncharacterized protein n=1 Tax=Agaricicola taiwanensis TaxID=591372 RepID=A0A8J3E1M0_9RHOB|nr:hypothetical protein [Agaricicola taiwanensis]GGE54379.1 hypothetical protein GCM10007276_34340 [Agaricicola taiwanensis]